MQQNKQLQYYVLSRDKTGHVLVIVAKSNIQSVQMYSYLFSYFHILYEVNFCHVQTSKYFIALFFIMSSYCIIGFLSARIIHSVQICGMYDQ